MKKTYIAPTTETIALMIEDAILGVSSELGEKGIDIKAGSVGAGASLSNQKQWGSSSIWNND